jgi:hypothetical protein
LTACSFADRPPQLSQFRTRAIRIACVTTGSDTEISNVAGPDNQTRAAKSRESKYGGFEERIGLHHYGMPELLAADVLVGMCSRLTARVARECKQVAHAGKVVLLCFIGEPPPTDWAKLKTIIEHGVKVAHYRFL